MNPEHTAIGLLSTAVVALVGVVVKLFYALRKRDEERVTFAESTLRELATRDDRHQRQEVKIAKLERLLAKRNRRRDDESEEE